MGQFYWVACDNITLKSKKLWKLFLGGRPAVNRQLDAQKNDTGNFNLVVDKRSTSSCDRKMAKAGQFFKGSYKVENVIEEHTCKSPIRKGLQMTSLKRQADVSALNIYQLVQASSQHLHRHQSTVFCGRSGMAGSRVKFLAIYSVASHAASTLFTSAAQ